MSVMHYHQFNLCFNEYRKPCVGFEHKHTEVHAVPINWPKVLSDELFSVNMSFPH